jgi:hypothetical protein
MEYKEILNKKVDLDMSNISISDNAYTILEGLVASENRHAKPDVKWTLETFVEKLINDYYVQLPVWVTEGILSKDI